MPPRVADLLLLLRIPLRKEAVRQPRQYRPLSASARTSTASLDPELSASNITATQKPSYSSNLIVDVKEEYIFILSLVSVRVSITKPGHRSSIVLCSILSTTHIG